MRGAHPATASGTASPVLLTPLCFTSAGRGLASALVAFCWSSRPLGALLYSSGEAPLTRARHAALLLFSQFRATISGD